MLSKTLKFLFVISLISFIATYFLKSGLPAKDELLPEIANDPIQTEVSFSSFETDIKGFKYTIMPKYEYELYGLIVTSYDSDNWLDYTHKEDPGNIKDICVVWGDNIKNESFRNVQFRSGQFTCFFEWKHELPVPFDIYSVSNNHMLPQNKEVFDKIKQAHVGDQIHIKGVLADYEIKSPEGDKLYQRHTSITRQDTGNGACEVVYATSFEILKKNNPALWSINEYSKYAIIVFLILIIINFFISPYRA